MNLEKTKQVLNENTGLEDRLFKLEQDKLELLEMLTTVEIAKDCINCKRFDACELLILADSPPLCRYNEKWQWEHQNRLDKIVLGKEQ